MKKVVLLSLIALALCAFPTNMQAENVCHAIAGEVTTDDGADHSRNGSFSFQMIVTQQELVAAGVQPGYISGITFNWLLLQTGDKSKQLSIYLASTSKSSFTSGSDYVPASDFPANPHYTVDFRRSPHILKNGENNYTFNTPFEWDGNSNIVVAVIANYTSQTGKNSTGFTALGGIYNVSRYLYSYAINSQYSVGVFSTASRSNFRPAVSFCQNNCLPANLAVSELTTNSAIVEWDDCAGCTNGFDVVCSESQITDFSTVTPQHITTNSIDLTSLDEYTDYYVYVRSCCGIYSAWSKALHFKTLLNCIAPENVNITDVQKHRITLNWTPKTSISSYDIILSTTALTDPSSAPITYANVTGSSKVLSNLQRETTYYIYIRANCDDLYYSEWVGGVSATTLPLACENPTESIFANGTMDKGMYPLYGSYCNYPQTVQSIYPESMLSGLVRKEITNLKYFTLAGNVGGADGGSYISNDHNWDNITFNIRMMTTDQTTLSDGIISTTDATLVYTGALQANVNESYMMEITLSQPFTYNGGNLLIEFETSGRDGNLTPSFCYFYGMETQNIVSYCIYDEGNETRQYSRNFLPKLQLSYCDYLLCPALESAPVASDITSNSATITWNAGSQGNASSYDMIVSLNPISDFTNVTPTHPDITTTSHNLTGLNTNTQYYVYVRANCTNGDESDGSSLWSPVCQFRTLKNITGITSFSIDNTITVVGNLNFDDEHQKISAVVAEETDLTTIPFTFTLADNTCVAKVGEQQLASPGTWDFTEPVTVRVYAEDRTVYEDWEITIIEVPCPAPKNFTVGQITSSTAQLSWTQNGSIRTWRIYGAQGNAFEVNSSNCTVNGNQYSYTLTGLIPNADYTLQLQGICGEDESSSLYAAEQPQFHTLNNAIGINSFEITNTDLQVVGVNIDNTTHTIKAVLAKGTDLTNKQIQFELTLADVNGIAKYNGGDLPQSLNFTNPVAIQVYAEDRNITPQQWTILVVVGTCVSPTNLSVTGIAAREATLNWSVSDPSATSFDLVVSKEQLADPSTGTVQDINGKRTQQLSPLTPDTHYYIYIRTDCGTETSRWSSVEFNTLPVYKCTDGNYLVANGTDTHAAYPVVSQIFNTKQKTQSIYSKSMLPDTLKGKKIKKLKYFVSSGSFSSNFNKVSFNIKIRTTNQSVLSSRFVDTTIPDSATTVYSGQLSAGPTNGMVINLTTPFEYTGGNLLIEFETDKTGDNVDPHCFFYGVNTSEQVSSYGHTYSNNQYQYQYAQSFLPKVEFTACEEVEVVVCPALTAAPDASEVKYNSATITWDEGTGEHLSSYDMIVSETEITDFTGATPAHQGITGTSYNLTSLNPNTQYYVYVRANCTANGFDDGSSQWSPVCSFRTLNNVTGITNFEITNATVIDNVTIDSETHNISAKVLDNANLNSLAFTYTLADATCTAKVGDDNFQSPGNFTTPVTVRVYAEDTEVFEDWTITIEKEPCPAPKNFGFVDQQPITSSTATLSWDQKGTGISWKIHVTSGDSKIEVSVSDGGVPKDRKLYTLSNLTPNTNYTLQLQASGSKCPDGVFAAEQPSFRTLNNATDITSFALHDESIRLMEGVTINSTDHTITATVHKGTNLTSVPFTIELAEGCTAEVNGQPFTSSWNFSNQVTVVVYAEDHNIYQPWTINITKEPCATPYDVRLTDIQKYQMTLEWSNQGVGESDRYDIVVSETALADPSTAPGTYSGVPGNSRVLDFLDRNTTYYVYLRNNCGGNLTTWLSATATTLDIQNPECPCPAVSAPQAENITSSSATITWDAGTGDFATTYDFVYSEAPIDDFAGVAPTAQKLNDMSYYLASLTPNTTYYAYVRVNCVNDHYNDGSSQWSPAGVFRTLNNVTDITSFSFNGDVEVDGVTIDNSAHTINATVGFGTDLSNLAFTLTLKDSEHGTAKYDGGDLPQSLDFTYPVTVVVYAEDCTIYQDWTITITPITCLAPNTFRAEQIASNSVQLSWIQNGQVDAWKIYGVTGDTINVNGDNSTKTDNKVQYSLTALTPNTDYTLRLKGDNDCSDSLYASDLSFRTLNNVVGISSFEITNATVAVNIDTANYTISVTTIYGTDLSNLAFTLELADTNGIAKVGEQLFSGSWNFTSEVIVSVYAEDCSISHDWTINVANETCATPYNISVNGIAERSATLNWNIRDNTTTSFDIVVSKEQLSDPSTGTVQDTTATNNDGVCIYALDHLTPDTFYHVYIRTDCGNNETSRWSSVEFNTMSLLDCGNTQPVVVANGTSNLNGRWKFPIIGIYCNFTQKTQSIYPASMLTDLMGNRISKLKYFVEELYGGLGNIEFNIKMKSTDQSTLSDFIATTDATLVYSGPLTPNNQNMEIALTTPFDYTGGNLLIEFELRRTGNKNYCFFRGIEADGVVSYTQYGPWLPEQSTFLPKVEFTTCEKLPACPEVTNVVATNIHETSATITWTASTGTYANTSDIYYSTTPVEDFIGIEPQITGITGNSQLIDSLTQNTTYYVYVRTHCDAQGYDDGISGWAEASFRTLPLCRIPGTLKATITGKHSATITWTNTSDDAQQANNFTYILSTTPIAEADLETASATDSVFNGTTVNLTSLTSDTTYYFYVKNVCTGAVNCSSPWVSCQFTMPAEMPAVINLQAHDIAHNAFTVTWESDSANFANETEWEVACVAHGETPTTWTQVSVVPEYFIFGLTAETTYDFYVRAKNGNNYSANAQMEVTTIQKSVVEGCQDVSVGENVYLGDVPVYSCYMGSYTVQIYTADDLRKVGCNGAGTIEKIAFFQTYCSDSDYDYASCYRKKTTVWIGNTTKGSFDNKQDWIHGLTKVMNEKPIDFNKNGDWVELQLDEPFYWDGESNLAVAVLAYSDDYTNMYFAGGYVESNRSIYSYTDMNSWSVNDGVPSYAYNVYTTTQLANIRLCFEHASCRSVDKLKVDNITNNTARAHWYPGDAETTWHVYNSTTEMTDDALDALTSSDYSEVTDNPEYNISGLNPNNDYYIYVRAVCGGNDGESRWRKYRYATPLLCSAPTKAVAYSQTDNSITFTATAGEVGTAGSYDYRYWVAGAEGSAVTVSNEQSPFTVTGLTAGDTYEWEVRANCSGNEGSSRWVRGNAVKVCGTVTLPWYSNFDQCDEGSVPDCWTVIEGGNDENYVEIEDWYPSALAFYGTSSVATPRFNFPAGDYDISMDLYIDYRVRGQMKVMFATDLSDESTYTTIHTIDMKLYESFNATLPLHIDAETTGYIVLSQTGSGYLYSGLYSLNVVESAVVDDGCSEFVAGYEGYFGVAPVYTNYDASYTIQIYTADELIDQGYQAGDISSIAFYQTRCDGSVEDKYKKNTTVWMGNTTKESFANDNDWITGLTKVMDEKPVNFNKNGDWVDLPLDNGKTFYWDGGSNLAVAVLAYSDKYCSMSFRGGKAGDEYRTIVTYQDDYEPTGGSGVPSMLYPEHSSYHANIKLCYAPGICPTVTGITVDDIDLDSAHAYWYSGDDETTWHVYNSPTKLTNAELAALDQTQQYTVVNTNPEIRFNNLIKDMDYYLYVRAACSADEVSHWRYYKYSTLPTCSAPVSPNATSDEDNSITFTVNPGDVGTVDTYDYRYWIAGTTDIVTLTGQTSTVTVNGLSGDQDYEWEVRANCSGTDEGSSRWVKGNTIHVCGVLTLPYFNDFEQYEEYDMLECWKVMESYTFPYNHITYPCIGWTYFYDYDYDREFDTKALAISNNSSIATPLINVPAEGLRISLDLMGNEDETIKVMFTTDLTADESAYTHIGTIHGLSDDKFTHDMLSFTPGGAMVGYIVFSYVGYVDVDMPGFLTVVDLDNLLIETIPTNDTKDVTVDNVTYTISGFKNSNDVTIEKVTFNENDLTEADFDITYSSTEDGVATNFLSYKHKLDIPATLTDVIKDRYKVVGIKADAFDDITLTNNVRVNVPLGMELEGNAPTNNEIVMKLPVGRYIPDEWVDEIVEIYYGGNHYYVSKAYKVNIQGGNASMTQRPFNDGSKPLQISYTDGDGTTESEIGSTNVYKTEGAMQFKYKEGAWDVNRESESGTFEAAIMEDEATIDIGRSNTITVAEDAQYNGTFDLTFCNELKFQSDNVNRSYPDCQLTGNMPLGDSTKVKAELSLNNKEYYYFSLPFDCELSGNEVLAGTAVVTRSATIDDAVNSTDLAAHHYVLFRWDESANDSAASGYAAYSGERLEKNRGYVIAVVESYNWYSEHESNYKTSSLDVTATFTASDNYTEIASSESEVEIPVTRADAVNAYSGWNLVGNPFYGTVMSSHYDTHSKNKYVRKVVFDRGDTAYVADYAPNIPDFNAEIKPFETVFIQKSDAAGDGTVTVSGTSPVQPVQGAPAILPEYITITLNDSSRMIDRTTIINDELSSDKFLQEEDLLKSHQSSNEIYTQYGDFDFSFNEMNITDADKTIPLAVKVAAEGDYTIAMSSGLSNYGTGQVFLHDKTLETYMKLSDGEVETLHLTEGTTEGRLEIVIKVDEVIVTPDDLENTGDDQLGIEVYMHHGIATIEGVEAGAIVTITDATGKTLYTTTAQSDRIDYQFTVRGVYMITVRNNANVNTVKVVY